MIPFPRTSVTSHKILSERELEQTVAIEAEKALSTARIQSHRMFGIREEVKSIDLLWSCFGLLCVAFLMVQKIQSPLIFIFLIYGDNKDSS